MFFCRYNRSHSKLGIGRIATSSGNITLEKSTRRNGTGEFNCLRAFQPEIQGHMGLQFFRSFFDR